MNIEDLKQTYNLVEELNAIEVKSEHTPNFFELNPDIRKRYKELNSKINKLHTNYQDTKTKYIVNFSILKDSLINFFKQNYNKKAQFFLKRCGSTVFAILSVDNEKFIIYNIVCDDFIKDEDYNLDITGVVNHDYRHKISYDMASVLKVYPDIYNAFFEALEETNGLLLPDSI